MIRTHGPVRSPSNSDLCLFVVPLLLLEGVTASPHHPHLRHPLAQNPLISYLYRRLLLCKRPPVSAPRSRDEARPVFAPRYPVSRISPSSRLHPRIPYPVSHHPVSAGYPYLYPVSRHIPSPGRIIPEMLPTSSASRVVTSHERQHAESRHSILPSPRKRRSFAMGRLRMLPPPAHGRMPGRALSGGCEASRRVAWWMVLHSASTIGM